MGQELTQANETLLEFERLIQTGGCNAWEGTLRTGVDLGTANIVLAVVDEQNRPVAGASYPSTVVRDGIVVDYMGAVRAVTHLKGQLEERLGREGTSEVAVDSVGAGTGEIVIVCKGSSARYVFGKGDAPVDTSIVGIVDTVEVG